MLNNVWYQWTENIIPSPGNIYNYQGVLYRYVPNVNIVAELDDGMYSTGPTGTQDGTMVTNICEALQAAINGSFIISLGYSVFIATSGYITITAPEAEEPTSIQRYNLTIPNSSLSDLVGFVRGGTLTPTWANSTLTWQFPGLPQSTSTNVNLIGATLNIGSSVMNPTPGPNNPLWPLAPMIIELEVFCVKF